MSLRQARSQTRSRFILGQGSAVRTERLQGKSHVEVRQPERRGRAAGPQQSNRRLLKPALHQMDTSSPKLLGRGQRSPILSASALT